MHIEIRFFITLDFSKLVIYYLTNNTLDKAKLAHPKLPNDITLKTVQIAKSYEPTTVTAASVVS